jgi:ABC-2 type transport system ATP-binding protein
MTAAIEIENFRKTYSVGIKRKEVVAVNDISLTVDQGEAFGFIGPNGAGKSTTIKVLTGVQRPTSGSAKLFGVPVGEPDSRRRLGYVPENPYLYDYLTPLEILVMSVRLHGVRLQDERGHCMKWLERFQLSAVANRTIRSFSKGMTQRVALAQAMCIEPRLLILDEPLSGLDPVGRRDVVELLSEYKKGGGTLFFTSHVLHDVERLADRFGLIHEGQLRSVRSPGELVGDEEVFLVRSMGEAAVEGMREDSAGRWAGEISRSALWAHLDALRAAGHTLVEVKSTLSLEAAFMRVIGHQK